MRDLQQQTYKKNEKNALMGFYAAGLNSSHRYEELVDYIALNYKSTAEVGIGHFPDIAFALLAKGVKVFATDVLPFHYNGLKVVVDDITCPNISTYKEIDLIYSLRPPPEMVPYMVRLAGILSADLIVKPLSSEYPGGRLTHSGKTTFFIWEYS